MGSIGGHAASGGGVSQWHERQLSRRNRRGLARWWTRAGTGPRHFRRGTRGKLCRSQFQQHGTGHCRPVAPNSHSANFRGATPVRINGFGGWGSYGVFRRFAVNPLIYGWPFGLYGVGWSGPLWWAIGYPGWGIYPYDMRQVSDSDQRTNRGRDPADRTRRARIPPRHYGIALRAWQHAMVDTPGNGAVVLLIAQALFALGHFEDAAGSVQLAMQLLSEDQWGNVVKNYASSIPTSSNIPLSSERSKGSRPIARQSGASVFARVSRWIPGLSETSVAGTESVAPARAQGSSGAAAARSLRKSDAGRDPRAS